MRQDENNGMKWVLGAVVIAVVAVGAYAMLTTPDDRTAGEHISDAADNLDEGLDDAARELENRTPAERIGDEVEDATDGDAN